MGVNKSNLKGILNIRNKIFIVLIITGIVILSVIVYFNYQNSFIRLKKMCISEKACFFVEIADTNEKRILGLSGRDFLDKDRGMLFVFPEDSMPGFWMKDMNFSLDIIWIDKDFSIVGIEKNIPPCIKENACQILYPNKKIRYVLEINSGLSEIYKFQVGDIVYFS